MSEVRMCDRCGAIFSTNREGWQTFTGSQRTMVDGLPRHITANMDACPECAVKFQTGEVQPRIIDTSAKAPGLTTA